MNSYGTLNLEMALNYIHIYIYIDASLVRLTSFALLEPWRCVEVVRGAVRGVVREAVAVRKQNARGLS